MREFTEIEVREQNRVGMMEVLVDHRNPLVRGQERLRRRTIQRLIRRYCGNDKWFCDVGCEQGHFTYYTKPLL